MAAVAGIVGVVAGAGAGPAQAVGQLPGAGAAAWPPGHVEPFDWYQRYGPLNWPRTGHEVLDVQAAHADYWKAENLDVFNGRGWVTGQASGGNQLAGVDQRGDPPRLDADDPGDDRARCGRTT